MRVSTARQQVSDLLHAAALQNLKETRAANPLTQEQLLAYDRAYNAAKANGSLRRAEVDRDLDKQVRQGDRL